ncbi:hypothetical protein MFIFM68171_02534 [Madurella fahalii]|uniref:Uncharacterized protein n=1 Tax=Madurella fahalii TaxID=1157608 RepID=A0ABQ0G3P0_9PEZI
MMAQKERNRAEGSVGKYRDRIGCHAPEPLQLELFREAVKNATAYVLTDGPLIPRRPFTRVGLLVGKSTKATAKEGWVCLTFAIGETEESYLAQRQSWLLLHGNPAVGEAKLSSELNYYMFERGP